ncbi:MAG: hypothetical protein WD029_03950, partial [Microthrixaceae bacterium]
ILFALGAAVISGCGGAVADPKDYGDVNTKNEGYYGNLMYGCTGVRANEAGKYEDVTLENTDYCNCLYEGLKETVPFSDAREFDKYQATAQAGEIKVPTNIQTVQEKCGTTN